MKLAFATLLALFLLSSCQEEVEYPASMNPEKWKNHEVLELPKLPASTKTYLSVYSEIFHRTDKQTYNLTATVSIRNMYDKDTLYLISSKYFNTAGNLLRSYHKKPICLLPLETIEIVVNEKDTEGGTGANFIFEWAMKNPNHHALFEAVMVSTSGQQGISFTTQGKNLNP